MPNKKRTVNLELVKNLKKLPEIIKDPFFKIDISFIGKDGLRDSGIIHASRNISVPSEIDVMNIPEALKEPVSIYYGARNHSSVHYYLKCKSNKHLMIKMCIGLIKDDCKKAYVKSIFLTNKITG